MSPEAPARSTAFTDDRAHVFHSWSAQELIDPVPVARGAGSYFWDTDGNRYLDLASQLVNLNLGHQHPRMVAAIQEQAARLCSVSPALAVDVRSEAGRGTTFRIHLPKAGSSALQPASQDEELPAHGGNETILCVEDDRKIRDYVSMQLETLGYKVIAAGNADEALAIVRQGAAFDLLFTDIVMPGSMNGRQLAETLMDGRPSLRVLFTSGYSDGALPQQGRVGQGIPLLTKPYRPLTRKTPASGRSTPVWWFTVPIRSIARRPFLRSSAASSCPTPVFMCATIFRFQSSTPPCGA